MKKLQTPSQIAAWYHSQILRIPHGNQNPSKRYLTAEQVLELFGGTVVIQEKVDGKLSWNVTLNENCDVGMFIDEDMTGKHTVHKHVMKYTSLPYTKRVLIDYICLKDGVCTILPIDSDIEYVSIILHSPTTDQIYRILGALAQSQSHFGSPTIEGLVIKNYDKQLFGKWINNGFEDKLND